MLILALTHIQDSELHKSPETLQKDCINMKNHVCIFTQGHTHTQYMVTCFCKVALMQFPSDTNIQMLMHSVAHMHTFVEL